LCDVLGAEGGHVDEWEKECLDCGWRGMVAELTGEAEDSSVRSPVSCPDCGGSEFEQRADKDEKENA
jgi:hypothetical protein